MTNPPPDSPSPYSGEFLLRLLHQGRNPGAAGAHGTGNCVGDRFWSSSSDDACQSSSSNHSSSSFSRGSSLDVTASFAPGDEHLGFAFVDPAVAALGPSHPLSGSSRLEAIGNLQLQQHHHHHHHHEHSMGWSIPQHPASSNLPINQHDVMVRCVPDHVLPSPMDPLFRPTFSQTFKNASDCFQPPAHPYPQYSGSPPAVDYNAYVRHSPPFFPPPGFLNAQISQEPWFNNAAPLQRMPERALPGLTRQASAVPPYGSSRVGATDRLKGNKTALLSSNPSHLEDISLSREELGVGLSLPKHYGPIGPLKHRGESVYWGMSASVENGWNSPDQSFELYSSSASEILNKQGSESKISGNVLEQLFIDAAQDHLNSSTHGITECVELVSEGSAAQASKVSPSPTTDWIGWTDLTDGHSSGVPKSQQKENLDNRDGAGRVANVSEGDSMHRLAPQSKASYRKLIGPQRADAPGKSLLKDVVGRRVAGKQEKTVDSVIESGSFDFGSFETQTKSNPFSLESGMISKSHENQKVHDDIKKRRGQAQEWRLKQPALLHRKSTVSGSRSKEPAKENNTRTNIEGQGHLGPPSGANLNSAPSSAIEQSKQALHTSPLAGNIDMAHVAPLLNVTKEDGSDDAAILGCVSFLELDNGKEAEEVSQLGNGIKASQASEELKSSELVQHKHTFDWPTRFHRRDLPHRDDLEKCNGQLISIFEKLIPSEDEELRRKQLLSSLDELVVKIWPEARLYLFGSCANAFGVCNSDIDVCLSVDGENSSKSELVLRLADTLKASNMQNVQALTHARVPIVKYSDPTTDISCDVCINNMLAVVNTKLLHDYAQIDVRLRQLAFIVKHWAKCRQVNETYRGTLSSYAYVLMCIHFLQQRRPPVLPCLQEMEPTYDVTVGDISCAYYDQVARLKNFGSKNKETLGELLMAFFDYWAFKHDYSHAVISIRTGRFLSKVEKDWTRRIGNERHLICIEDPFETTHDLGRVVDKHSIRVLREEFQRAAKIMRHHANPCVALFKWE